MKHSDILSKNGIIFNQITDIVAKAELKQANLNLLVICNDTEIFDEAMTTLMNRVPQATGLVLKPNPGVKMAARYTTVSAVIGKQKHIIKLDVMTADEYTNHQVEVDAKTYDEKHTIMWTGGEN